MFELLQFQSRRRITWAKLIRFVVILATPVCPQATTLLQSAKRFWGNEVWIKVAVWAVPRIKAF